MNQQQQLPNATTALVMGILSIVLGCGVLGLIFGIIGLVVSKEGKRLHEEQPDMYLGYGNLNAGRIMSIIGIVLGGLSLLYLIIVLIIGGSILGLAGGLSHWN